MPTARMAFILVFPVAKTVRYCSIRHINGDKDKYDVVDEKVKGFITYQWEEYGELGNKDDVYNVDFMAECYADGATDAQLRSHFGFNDHHIYDQIQKVLVRVIKVVMSYVDLGGTQNNRTGKE